MANRYKKTNGKAQNAAEDVQARRSSGLKVWIARGLIFLLCAAVAITLIPSALF